MQCLGFFMQGGYDIFCHLAVHATSTQSIQEAPPLLLLMSLFLPLSLLVLADTMPRPAGLGLMPLLMQVSFLAFIRFGAGKSLCMLLQGYAIITLVPSMGPGHPMQGDRLCNYRGCNYRSSFICRSLFQERQTFQGKASGPSHDLQSNRTYRLLKKKKKIYWLIKWNKKSLEQLATRARLSITTAPGRIEDAITVGSGSPLLAFLLLHPSESQKALLDDFWFWVYFWRCKQHPLVECIPSVFFSQGGLYHLPWEKQELFLCR